MYGLGANYYFASDPTGGAGINVDWTRIGGDVESDLFMANLVLRFN